MEVEPFVELTRRIGPRLNLGVLAGGYMTFPPSHLRNRDFVIIEKEGFLTHPFSHAAKGMKESLSILSERIGRGRTSVLVGGQATVFKSGEVSGSLNESGELLLGRDKTTLGPEARLVTVEIISSEKLDSTLDEECAIMRASKR